MSVGDSAVSAAVLSAATVCDGALLGLALGYCAVDFWSRYRASAAALRRIEAAPALRVSDLSALLPPYLEGEGAGAESARIFPSSDRKLVVVRGRVQGSWAFASSSKSRGVLEAQGTGDPAVIVKQTKTCLYNEYRGIFGWKFGIQGVISKTWKEQQSCLLRSVPFILVEDVSCLRSGYIHVDLDGSKHPLPLTTVYHHLHPVHPTYTLFQALFGNGIPVALLDEEKVLPVGKEITAVGICIIRDEEFAIKSCPELPYFLTDFTKFEIESDLAYNSRVQFWFGIVLGTLSIGVLCYAVMRNWSRLKGWMQRRQRRRPNIGGQPDERDDIGDVPDGQLCVICLTRRRRSAFVPCGHLVCCPRCVISVEQSSSPKCPVCRQHIRSSMRIYDS